MDIKNPTASAYVATLPCETLISAKQAINDKVQGSGATYLRCRPCGGVVNNQIKKGLLQLHARAWWSHALCTPGQHIAKNKGIFQ